jgi:hypothetical protein
VVPLFPALVAPSSIGLPSWHLTAACDSLHFTAAAAGVPEEGRCWCL